jgi:NTP pyrophosphatase (non-canonical NTP hydrolase)
MSNTNAGDIPVRFDHVPLTFAAGYGQPANQFLDYTIFVQSMKVFPEKHAIVYPALGMIGEAGEVSEKVKKWLRGDKDLDKEDLIREIGDVLWYCTALAIDLGYTLDDVARMNIDKLNGRKERGTIKGSGDNR